MSTASEKWAAMNDAGRNEWIAANVMRWKRADRRAMGWGVGPVVWITAENPDDPNSNPTVQDPQFTTDVAADYLVLCLVRETWDELQAARFADRLISVWESRLGDYALHYHPGDYSHAAYLALSGGN